MNRRSGVFILRLFSVVLFLAAKGVSEATYEGDALVEALMRAAWTGITEELIDLLYPKARYPPWRFNSEQRSEWTRRKILGAIVSLRDPQGEKDQQAIDYLMTVFRLTDKAQGLERDALYAEAGKPYDSCARAARDKKHVRRQAKRLAGAIRRQPPTDIL